MLSVGFDSLIVTSQKCLRNHFGQFEASQSWNGMLEATSGLCSCRAAQLTSWTRHYFVKFSGSIFVACFDYFVVPLPRNWLALNLRKLERFSYFKACSGYPNSSLFCLRPGTVGHLILKLTVDGPEDPGSMATEIGSRKSMY
jgi:hypothetical protein